MGGRLPSRGSPAATNDLVLPFLLFAELRWQKQTLRNQLERETRLRKDIDSEIKNEQAKAEAAIRAAAALKVKLVQAKTVASAEVAAHIETCWH